MQHDQGSATYVDLLDVDRDGLPDRVMVAPDVSTACYKVQRNTGNGFAAPRVWGRIWGPGGRPNNAGGFEFLGYSGTYGAGPLYNQYAYTRLIYRDVTGDGLPDRVSCFATPAPGFWTTDWCIQAGTGQTDSNAFPPVYTAWYGSRGPDIIANDNGIPNVLSGTGWTMQDLIDVDGDGKPDNISIGSFTARSAEAHVHLNVGNSFSPQHQIWHGLPAIYETETKNDDDEYSFRTITGLFDMNGDGLPDLVKRVPDGNAAPLIDVTPGNGYGVARNNDFGYATRGRLNKTGGSSMTSFLQGGLHGVTTEGATRSALIDINGDGLPDRVLSDNSDHFTVYINTGSSLSDDPVYYYGLTGCGHGEGEGGLDIQGGFGKKVDLIDMNGDGLPDRVLCGTSANNYAAFYVQLNKGPYPDLLSTVSNGIGGEVAVAYTPSSAFINRNKAVTREQDPWASNAVGVLGNPVVFKPLLIAAEWQGCS